MSCASVDRSLSLDQQYLDFRVKTSRVFEEYPQLEPLRYSIFKELLVRRDHVGLADHIKHWIRPVLRRKRSQSSAEGQDVLLFIEGRREVIIDAILPVHRELAARGVKVVLMSFRGGHDTPTEALEFQVPAAATPPSWASPAWDGLCAAVEGLRDHSLKKSFYYSCATTKALLDECDRVLDMVKPKVVLTASNPMEGGVAMGIASQARGALTVQLQHGILQPFYTPVVSDYMVTWGRSSSETLERLGVEGQKLWALGSPRHDAMVSSKDGSARRTLLQALELPDRPTFAFFSNGNDLVRNGSAPVECAHWLESVAAEYPNVLNVIVRLHPNEDGSLFKNCPHLHITKQIPDLATTLDGCDWVGSLCSTVLYDALVYGKPVWQFYADGWPNLADNWRHGLARRISSEQALREAINKIVHEGPDFVEEGLCEEVFANHGQASAAVADFVLSQLSAD